MAQETVIPPKELPPAELALLRAYRDENRMPAAAKSGVGRRLDAARAANERRGVARLVAIGAALAAVALLGWWVSTLRAETAAVSKTPGSEQAAFGADDSAELHEVEEHTVKTPAPRPAPHTTVVVQPEVEQEAPPVPEPTPPRPRKDRSAKAPAPEPQDPGPSALLQERDILGQAWAALARGAHDDALAQTELHAKRFPAGTLKVERRAIATIAGCKAKRPGWAKKSDAFLQAHGKTPLARRVREACSP